MSRRVIARTAACIGAAALAAALAFKPPLVDRAYAEKQKSAQVKFTPKEKSVTLRSSQDDVGLLIEVIDEGCGIDESIDLFAPFKRQGNKSGAGLGLFLAKSAADALRASISLTNRTAGVNGTVASLQLNSKLSCILPKKTKSKKK